MRVGITSDIHPNLNALQAVLERLAGVGRLICPDDVVGCSPDPVSAWR